jgi:hypothetical protein
VRGVARLLVLALALAPAPPLAQEAGFDVVAPPTRSATLDKPALALAFLDDGLLAALFPEAAALYRWNGPALVEQSRLALPGSPLPVRAPGGLILAPPREAAFWALSSRFPRAFLLAVEGGALVRRSEAEALPWPGCATGLRFRLGTNLIEGTLEKLGEGPFLAIAVGTELAVLPDGRLRGAGGASRVRAGPALAPLGDGIYAAPSANPPGALDSLLLLSRDGETVQSVQVAGSVRALASRVRGAVALLVAAVETPAGGGALVRIELRRKAAP